MTISRGALAVASLAIVAAACGSSVSLDEVPAKAATAACAVEQRCLGLGFTVLTGDGNCESVLTQSIDNGLIASLRTAVANGTVVYHDDKTQACIDALAAADCASLANVDAIPACRAVVDGTVAAGGNCSINAECTGDAYCKRAAPSMGSTCPGVCTARVGVGAHCSQPDDCSAGAYCDGSGTCTAPATEGQPCRGAMAPECAVGLDCVGVTMMTPGTCRTNASELSAAVGATCDLQNGVFCMAGLSCAIEGIVGTTPTEMCEMPVAAGAACKIAVPEMCPAGQYCQPTVPLMPAGTCTALPGVGQPCRTAPFPGIIVDPCLGDAACISDGAGASTCREAQVNGAACTVDGDCWSGRCVSGTCAEPESCS